MRILVITVHGIRTFGNWQQRLEALVRSDCAPGDQVDFVHYRYGYFSAPAFLVPPLRALVTRRFANELQRILADVPPDTKICIFGHSFGTHIIAWSLYRLRNSIHRPIDTVVLAGSVLRSSFQLGKIAHCVRRVVNECGVRDSILLLSQLFVLFTGAAGRLGIHGFEGRMLTNRFFPFGHSEYFEVNRQPTDGFMNEFWKPLILTDASVRPQDCRVSSAVAGVQLFLINNIEPVKLALWCSPLVALVLIFGKLFFEARENLSLAYARAASSQAQQILNTAPDRWGRAALFAAEGLARRDLPETDRVARNVYRAQVEAPILEVPDADLLGAGEEAIMIAKDGRSGSICLVSVEERAEKWCRKIEHTKGEEMMVSQAWFSSNELYVGVYYNSGVSEVYQVANGKRLHRTSDEIWFSKKSLLTLSDKGITRWDLPDMVERQTFPRPPDTTRVIELSADRILAVTINGEIFNMDTKSGRTDLLPIRGTEDSAWSIRAATDDAGYLRVVLHDDRGRIASYGGPRLEEQWSIPFSSRLMGLSLTKGFVNAVGRDRSYFYDRKSGVLVHDVAHGPTRSGGGMGLSEPVYYDVAVTEQSRVISAVESPNGNAVVISSINDKLDLPALPHAGSIRRLKASSRGDWIAAAFTDPDYEDSSIWVWRVPEGPPAQNTFAKDWAGVKYPRLTFDGTAIVATNAHNELVRWDLRSAQSQVLYKVEAAEKPGIEVVGGSVALLWSPPNSYVSVNMRDGKARTVPAQTIEVPECNLKSSYGIAPVMLSDGRHFAFSPDEGCAGFADLHTLEVRPLTLPYGAELYADPSSPRVFSLSQGNIRAHSLDDTAELLWSAPKNLTCNFLGIDPMATHVYTLCAEHVDGATVGWLAVRVSLLGDKTSISAPIDRYPRSLSLSTNGDLLAVAMPDTNTVAIFDTQTMRVSAKISNVGSELHFVQSDTRLAVGRDGRVDIYDSLTGRHVAQAESVVAFTRDGNGLVYEDPAKGYRIEPIDPAALVERLCALARRAPTLEEWRLVFANERYSPVCQNGKVVNRETL